MCTACVRRGWRGMRWGGIIVLTLALAAARAVAVVGGEVPPESDRRFDAVALLFTDQPWAPCGGWISGTCTLIDRDLVLLARHSVQDGQRNLPAAGARTHKVRFRRDADGRVNGRYGGSQDVDCAGGYQEIYIHEFFGSPFPGIDLVIGRLERPPVGIQPMPIRPSHAVRAGEPIVLAGWGYDGQCYSQGDHWTLRMKTGYFPSPLRYNAWCCFDYNHAVIGAGLCLTTPAGTNWVIGNLHDSGAPLLSPDPEDPLRLRVVAIVTGINGAQKLSAWNDSGGQPALVDTPLRPMCLTDLNGDGTIGVEDLLIFINGFLNGAPLGDVDGIPGITLNDLFVYLLRFMGGCG